MKHLTQALVVSCCLLFVLLVVAGCGGGDEAAPMLSKTTLYSSDYAGPYAGSVFVNSGSTPMQVGTIVANISGINGIVAVFTDSSDNSKVTFNCTMKANGTFTGTSVSQGTPVQINATWSVNGGVGRLEGTWSNGEDTGTFWGTCDPDAGQSPRKIVLPPAYSGTMKLYNNTVTVVTALDGTISITVPGPNNAPVTFLGGIMTDGTWKTTGTVQGAVYHINGNWAINNGLLHITGTEPDGDPIDFTVAPTV